MRQTRERVAVIGCGNRGRVYMDLVAEQADRFEIVAAADPIPSRVSRIKSMAGGKSFKSFSSADDLLDAPKLADVLFVTTQDRYHYEPCIKALHKGYDLVLEKPMCSSIEDIIKLEEVATRLERRVVVCHVLRYTSFYRKLFDIVQSGQLGTLISVNASEGIGPWHFAHSYVRGHWSVMEDSTPTIVAKCSHDMDILHWLIGSRCKRISSFGSLSFFKKENASLEAEYPMFAARRYIEPNVRSWLAQVFDYSGVSEEEILTWLDDSPWGRSVFACNNSAVDHQVVSLEFEGEITATFTMNAFDEGRNYEITGTKARLRAGDFCSQHMDCDIVVSEHAGGKVRKINVKDQNPHPKYGGYHNGGDVGFIKALPKLLGSQTPPLTSLSTSMHSHLMAFAAEEARRTKQVIELSAYYQGHKSSEHALD